LCPALLEIVSTKYTSLLWSRCHFQLPHMSVRQEVSSNTAWASFAASILIKYKQLSVHLMDAIPLCFNIEVHTYVFTSITQQNSLKYHYILF